MPYYVRELQYSGTACCLLLRILVNIAFLNVRITVAIDDDEIAYQHQEWMVRNWQILQNLEFFFQLLNIS